MSARSARRGGRRPLRLALWGVGVLAGFLVVFGALLRFGGPRTRDAIRVFNKWVLNPVMLRFAGRRHWYASVLWHAGRRSGQIYATPVVARPVAGGFVIPLPYGEDVDWLRNVRAAGRATLRFDGTTYTVRSPEVVELASVPDLDAEHRKDWQRFRIERLVRLSTDEELTGLRAP